MSEREIFEGALEHHDPAERRAYLNGACGGNAALRERVEALLRSHESTSRFLNVPAPEQLTPRAADGPTRTIDPASPESEADAEPDAGPDLSFLGRTLKPGGVGTLGHYEVQNLLGQGAFGLVFRAFDERLHRHVAIKVLSPQLAATSPPRKRFLREARSAAAVKHENVVQVYAVEEHPLPYLVMELVDGLTLKDKLNGAGPLDTTEVLSLGRQIAAGLAAAHEKGLIHRDIKPANILIEPGVEPRVKLSDFGLARAVDDASMTRSGVISGTPMYMAPEQAQGLPLDHRADLFSLGSVLYQMVSGRPPFRAASTVAVLKRVTDETPRPIQEIVSTVPEWLCTIIAKLHAKQPEDRFQSAKEVADLLARCETDLRHHGRVELPSSLMPSVPEPVTNRSEPTPTPPRGSRRRAIAAVCVLAVLGGVVLAEATGVVHLGDMVRRRPVPDTPEAEKAEPQPPSDKAPPSPNLQPVATVPADSLRREDIPLAVLATLGGGDPARAPADLVAVFGEGRFRAIGGPRAPAFSPDGSTVAIGAGHEVHLFNAGSGERLNVFGPFGMVVSTCFSPDGTTLAIGDRVVNLLDIRTGRLLQTLRPKENNEVDWLSFTPDGRRLVVGSQNGLGTTPVWDLKSGAVVQELPPLVCGGGKDSAGRLLVLARAPGDDRVNAYLAETGKLAFPGPKWPQFKWPHDVTRASLSASGRQLALGKPDRVAVWDVDSLRENPDAKPVFDKKTPGSWLRFAHTSGRLWTAEFKPDHLADFYARCWDPSTGEEVASVAFLRPSADVWFALSPDDSTLFASSRYQSLLQLYDTRSGTLRLAHRGHTDQVHTLAFSPDGHLLASGGQDGKIRVWQVATGTEKYTFSSWSWIQNVAFNHDGSRLASRDSVGTVTLWRMTDGSRVWSTKTAEGHGQKLRFSPDGMLIALTTREGGVRFLRAADGSEANHWPDLHRDESRGVAFSPDGTRFASAGLDGTLVVAEIATGRVLNRFASKTSAEPVEFTVDGTAVLCGYFSPEPVIRQWNLKSEQSEVYKGHGGIISSLSLRGQLLASCGHDRVIRLWDLTDSARRSLALAALPDSAQPDRVALSPDGRYLASANQDGTLHIFRLNRPGEGIRDWMAARQGPLPGLKNDAWLKRVEGLHGVNLFDAVRDRFRELNPDVEIPVQGAAIRKGNVTSVDMNSSKVADFSPLRALPDIQSLGLFETSFSDKDFGYIRGATGLRDLHCGYFFGTKNVTDKAVEVIREFKELESLDIWGTQLTDTGLGQLHTLSRLKKLILGRTRITDAGMPTLARFPELTELRLNFDNISDAGLPPLKGLKLQVLALERTATSDAGLKDIAEIRSLRKLDLMGTKVKGPGLLHLKALPDLRELWLDGAPVSGEGLRNLAELPALEQLGLGGTLIGDDDLVHLKSIKRLKFVQLRETKVTADGVKKLAEELPNCAIGSSHGDFRPRNR